jgi:hypothetical protein
MSCLQLELFERSDADLIRSEVRDLEKSLGNVRRGMFSRHDELEKKYQEAREEIEKLKDAVNMMQDTMKNYEAALFPVSFLSGDLGVKSVFSPVSSLIMSSQNSSTGLSLPSR